MFKRGRMGLRIRQTIPLIDEIQITALLRIQEPMLIGENNCISNNNNLYGLWNNSKTIFYMEEGRIAEVPVRFLLLRISNGRIINIRINHFIHSRRCSIQIHLKWEVDNRVMPNSVNHHCHNSSFNDSYQINLQIVLDMLLPSPHHLHLPHH